MTSKNRQKPGTWVEYRQNVDGDLGTPPTVLRTFSSEVAALRSAMHNGTKAIYLPHGTTIEEALAEKSAEPSTRTPRASSGRAARLVTERASDDGVEAAAQFAESVAAQIPNLRPAGRPIRDEPQA
jgi:hypothetical protein